MKRTLLLLCALVLLGVNAAWAAYSTTTVTSAQDSKGNALVNGGFYRILLPSRGANVALKTADNVYVQAYNGLGILGYMWKVEADANGKALISTPARGYWKFTEYAAGRSKLQSSGTAEDCTHFQLAWYSSSNKTLNMFDNSVEGSGYSYGGVYCGYVLSNHGGVGNYMGIYNDITDDGSIFKFERFYQTLFVIETTDVNGVAVEGFPATVTINGNVTTAEYYTNSDNQITSFSTAYAAAYYIDGVEKTAEEVKNAINANTGTLTVTVKPRPFIASTNEAPAYYALMISSNANSWLEGSGTDVNCGQGRALPDITGRTNWMWQLVQDGTNGYRIYNVGTEKYIGGRTTTDGNLTLVDAASANSFIPVYNNGATIKFKDQTNNLWIDRSGGKTYAHTSGQQFTFKPMYKVDFSEAVAVNGGAAVSTIYVAADGSDSFTLPSNKLYSINGDEALGYVDAANAIASCSSNITVTVSDNSTKDVTYTLQWSDGSTIKTIENVSTNLLSPSSDFLPNGFANDFVTLSYSPAEITSETSEVVVTATWNGPFQLSDNFASAKWYTVGIHSAHENDNHIWKYDSDNSDIIATEAVATNAYASLSDKNYFCFVGNPYEGLSIYNKAAGSGMTLYKSTTNGEHAKMASTGSLFIPGASSESGKTIANGYACFILKDGTVRLNCYDSDSYNVNGWTDSGNGSTCWFKTPSSYPLNFLNAYVLTAPAGAVGTVNVAADVLSAGKDLKNYFADNPFYFATASMVEKNMVLQTLNKLAAASEITLGEGYYRVISAVPGFNATAAWYYNPAVSTTNIVWAKAATTAEHQVNSIFKFTANEDKWNIYSPNAQKSITTGNGTWNVQNAALGEAAPLTVTSIGAAQYTLLQSNNAQTLHAGGHSNGTGNSGNLVTWNSNGQGEASAWYIVRVDDIDLTLNDGGDGNYYATACLPFTVTLDGCEAYTLTLNSVKKGLTLSEAMTEVPAGTPVLLCGTSATATANIAADAAYGAPLTNTSLTGTYTDLTVTPSTDLFLGKADGKVGFYRWNGTTLKANRAYLPASMLKDAGVKGFAIQFDTATAIEALQQQRMANGQVFNLAGQRVSK
ncbi:MAG: hypothetical protein IKM76_02540, partial [Prevotella sp.]|nr:hypothetical protein [Prevotella sp.]